MIFVTVGTHEQPFDRLVKKMDDLVAEGVIREPVMIQTGYSTYEPKHCSFQKLLPYPEMERYTQEARIIITHGGPASFISALQVGKTPIVVPRKSELNEHVNDHQVDFSRAVAQRKNNILVVEDIEDLQDLIVNYDAAVANLNQSEASNNGTFCQKFQEQVEKLFR